MGFGGGGGGGDANNKWGLPSTTAPPQSSASSATTSGGRLCSARTCLLASWVGCCLLAATFIATQLLSNTLLVRPDLHGRAAARWRAGNETLSPYWEAMEWTAAVVGLDDETRSLARAEFAAATAPPLLAPLERPADVSPASRDHFDVQLLLKLLDDVARAGISAEAAREAYMSALSNLAPSGVLLSAPDPYAGAGGDAGMSAAWRLLHHALRVLAGSRALLGCEDDDASLPLGVTARGGRYLVAGHVSQAQAAMPNLVLTLVQWATAMAPGTAYVSLTEAGSSDATPFWLDLLRILLVPLRTPSRIITGATLPQPKGTSGPESLRQAAKLKNAAIAPFFDDAAAEEHCPLPPLLFDDTVGAAGAAATAAAAAAATTTNASGSNIIFETADGELQGLGQTAAGAARRATLQASETATTTTTTTTTVGAAAHDGSGATTPSAPPTPPAPPSPPPPPPPLPPPSAHPACFNPDWVLFVESGAFMCRQDFLRLMQYQGADLACGMDFAAAGASLDGKRRQLLARALKQQQQQQEAAATQAQLEGGSGSDGGGDQGRSVQAEQQPPVTATAQSADDAVATADADAKQNANDAKGAAPPKGLQLLDIRAGRDVDGARFTLSPPYVQHAASAARVADGLPLQAYCCWSGLTKARAAPFYAGLRFRAPLPGECGAGAPSLACDDLHRLGLVHVVVDPGVRLARDLAAAEAVRRAMPGVSSRLWSEVAESPAYWLTDSPAYERVECCVVQDGSAAAIPASLDQVMMCRARDVMATNFTQVALGPPPGSSVGGAGGGGGVGGAASLVPDGGTLARRR